MINIKESNKGKFTEQANDAGMGVQEFARHVLANKDDYNSTTIKRANFARNSSKWIHKAQEGISIPIKHSDVMFDYSYDPDYMNFLKTLPHNLSNPTTDYNMYRYWELNGKPQNMMEARINNPSMFALQGDGWHSGSVALNENGDYEFIKHPTHPTVKYELDWYNSPESKEFRKNYILDTSDPNKYFYRKTTNKKQEGGLISKIKI